MAIGSLTIDDFLARLGSSDPTPGGGALAALSGAMAAAMLAMVCNLTLGRPRFADVEPQVQTLLDRCLTLQRELLALADADAQAYLAVRDAYRLPRESEEEKGARTRAIETAMHGATDVPADTAATSGRVLDAAVEAAGITNPVALGDVAVATHQALGAARGATDQARMNLASLNDRAFVSRVSGQLDQVVSQAAATAEQALAAIQTRAAA